MADQRLLAAGFVATSISLVHSRARWMLPVHLSVVLIVVASHPLTAYFGRDGSLVVFVVYFVTVLNVLTSLRPQYKLLVASSAISVLLLEALLSLNTAPQDRFAGLPDYDDLVGEYGEGGFLVPNLDTMVVGDTGPARFVTNRLGFRDRNEVSYAKPPGTLRIMFIGDSFVSGFRTDQDDTVGKVLEDELRNATDNPSIEVLVVETSYEDLWVANYYSAPQSVEIIKFGDPESGR